MARLPQLDAYLAALDEEQALISLWRPADGNLRVVATAGSGKTRSMVALAARLVADGDVAPGKLVVTTFSNRASKVLLARLGSLLPADVFTGMRVGTFHALALRALRAQGGWAIQRCVDASAKVRGVGIPSGDVLWRAAVSYGKMPGTERASLKLDADAGLYTRACDLLRAKGYSRPEDVPADETSKLTAFDDAWQMVLDAKQALGVWDFADALAAYLDGLTSGQVPDYADAVLVDEAQDDSRVQLDIVRALARGGEQGVRTGAIVLVGDQRQAVHGWRGAYPELFRDAEVELDASTLQIHTNYRSLDGIVDLGNRVSAGRPWALGDAAVAKRGPGGVLAGQSGTTVAVMGGFEDDDACARWFAERVKADISAGVNPAEIAVLCRTNAQLGTFQGALVEAKVPCVVVGARSLFDYREVQTFLAYCVLSQLDAMGSLERVANYPKRYLGAKFLDAVRMAGGATGAGGLLGGAGQVGAIARAAGVSTPGTKRGALDLLDCLRRLRGTPWAASAPGAASVPMFLVELLATPQRAATSLPPEEGSPDEDRPGLYRAAATLAKRFKGPIEFVEFADRCNALTTSVHEDEDPTKGRVTLSTIHRGKGLEWRTVYVLASEGALPHWRSLPHAGQIEDEARLFYVACTRAEDQLVLLWTNQGHGPRGMYAGPSRFLKYVDKSFWTQVRPQGEHAVVADALDGSEDGDLPF